MNKVILIGRLTRDPDIRYSGEMAIARYTLAVDRKYKREEEQTADFIGCIAFGRNAQFAEKYLKQGIKIAIVGRIQTGSYTNKDGCVFVCSWFALWFWFAALLSQNSCSSTTTSVV